MILKGFEHNMQVTSQVQDDIWYHFADQEE